MPIALLDPFLQFPTGYRYVRLTISDTKAGANPCQLGEISWYVGASRQIPASSTGNADYSTVADSQDGNASTKWYSEHARPHVLNFDFGSKLTLTSYSFTSGDDSSYAGGAGARNPDDWTVAVSNDQTNWTTISTVANANLAAVDLTVLGTWSL